MDKKKQNIVIYFATKTLTVHRVLMKTTLFCTNKSQQQHKMKWLIPCLTVADG